jgi:hypothetical protein
VEQAVHLDLYLKLNWRSGLHLNCLLLPSALVSGGRSLVRVRLLGSGYSICLDARSPLCFAEAWIGKTDDDFQADETHLEKDWWRPGVEVSYPPMFPRPYASTFDSTFSLFFLLILYWSVLPASLFLPLLSKCVSSWNFVVKPCPQVTNAIELEKDTEEEEAYWLEFPRYGAGVFHMQSLCLLLILFGSTLSVSPFLLARWDSFRAASVPCGRASLSLLIIIALSRYSCVHATLHWHRSHSHGPARLPV